MSEFVSAVNRAAGRVESTAIPPTGGGAKAPTALSRHGGSS